MSLVFVIIRAYHFAVDVIGLPHQLYQQGNYSVKKSLVCRTRELINTAYNVKQKMFFYLRIIRNWDFEPRQVSQATKQYLALMSRKPVINIKQENSKLFAVVQELDHVNQLRRNIISLKKYMVVCRVAQKQKILLCLISKQHFVDGHELYSMEDLIEVKNGLLVVFLENIIKVFMDHIHNCVLCLAKGFICEICDQQNRQTEDNSRRPSNEESAELEWSVLNYSGDPTPKVIFPFDSDTSTCEDCYSVYHRLCLKKANGACPKCTRLQIRQMSLK